MQTCNLHSIKMPINPRSTPEMLIPEKRSINLAAAGRGDNAVRESKLCAMAKAFRVAHGLIQCYSLVNMAF